MSSDPIQLIAVSAPPFTIIRVYVPIAAGEIAIEELLPMQRQNTHNHHIIVIVRIVVVVVGAN